MKLSHRVLTYISGTIWLAVGFFLFTLGLNLLTSHLDKPVGNYPLITTIAPYFGGAVQATIVLIATGLYVGFLKGKHVLAKSARQGFQRIQQLPCPAKLTQIYSAKYYILLGGMMGLGVSIKYLGIPYDIRGLVDLAIGAALIQGALVYYRLGSSLKPAVE